ncbi:MAG TPA: formate dehydrogenase accessory protein FdhE, partial [Reyranella sp.]|nr:formate dehydrogenase accessory protein FdhE [Reyranella sp.]
MVPPGSRQALSTPDNTVGEVAAGDPVRLPDLSLVFRQRSQRLAVLAEGHELQGFLRMIAAIMAAQHAALDGLPPGRLDFGERDGTWRAALARILDTVDPALLPDAAREAREVLRAAKPGELEALADHFL